MIIALALLIIVAAVLHYEIRKNNDAQQTLEDRFWRREQAANFTRRKDISCLNYLTIPPEKIPQNLHTEAENTLVRLSSCQMLNLNGKTNTDLKLEYGAANLEALTGFDDNFTEFARTVPVYAKELIEAGQTAEAQELLELAVSYQADISAIYTTLADLYQQAGQGARIQSLVETVNEMVETPGRTIILSKLKDYTQPSTDEVRTSQT
jgi:predicted Zn-dependent protease